MNQRECDANVFELRPPFRDPVRQKLFGMMRKSMERVFLIDQLNRLYQAARPRRREGDFLENALARHGRATCR